MSDPQVFWSRSDSEESAAADLAAAVTDLGISAPFVVSSVHGTRLTTGLKGPRPPAAPHRDADQDWAAALGASAHRAGADALVAAGGGRCLDVAKLAAAHAGLTLVAVPTQLSHDGLCSPVAVVPGPRGGKDSVGAIAPRAVFLARATLLKAPIDSVRAGLGDLIANPVALKDWALAAEAGLEEIDKEAWDLSVESFGLVEGDLDRDVGSLAADPGFLERLAHSLVLSGIAMIRAGSSRPSSGAEHEISHAIDELFGGRAMHGAQVAFGTVVSRALYEEDHGAQCALLERLGLPCRPQDLGLDHDSVVKLLLEAPATRPGRFTILEHADLDAVAASSLVARIWGR